MHKFHYIYNEVTIKQIVFIPTRPHTLSLFFSKKKKSFLIISFFYPLHLSSSYFFFHFFHLISFLSTLSSIFFVFFCHAFFFHHISFLSVFFVFLNHAYLIDREGKIQQSLACQMAWQPIQVYCVWMHVYVITIYYIFIIF